MTVQPVSWFDSDSLTVSWCDSDNLTSHGETVTVFDCSLMGH